MCGLFRHILKKGMSSLFGKRRKTPSASSMTDFLENDVKNDVKINGTESKVCHIKLQTSL